MRHQLLLAVLLGGSLLAVSTAQETKKDVPSKGTDVEIHFLNGSTVRAQLQSEKLEIDTPYGKLAVPTKDVRSIEFGSHIPDGYAEKIQLAVKKLGSSDFRERAKAVTDLVDLGPYSYAAAVAASKSKEGEVASRGKDVVQKLHAKHAKKDLKIMADDRVITPTFPIIGRILTPSLKAKADYFGTVELSLADMRHLRTIGGPSLEVGVAVDAAKYGSRTREWLATSFEVDGRSAILITAKGQVDLAPEEGGQIVVGPNGQRVGLGGPAGIGFGKKGGVASKTAAGMLIGKIGESGDTFTIGERFEGTPAQEGKLYLQINPSNYSTQSAGSYEVKVMRKQD